VGIEAIGRGNLKRSDRKILELIRCLHNYEYYRQTSTIFRCSYNTYRNESWADRWREWPGIFGFFQQAAITNLSIESTLIAPIIHSVYIVQPSATSSR